MRAPSFWQDHGLLPRLLAPLSHVVAGVTARRVAQPGWRAPVPVVCCGNASVGGTGKTTLALDIGARLLRRGAKVAFITRGYGGNARATMRVEVNHDVTEVGDEALLLAAVAPAYVGRDRAASARAAIAGGATVLVMDDGLQNPGLLKDLSFLVVDGTSGFGNGRVLPAGPLREPVASAAGRCQAAVLIGPDLTGAAFGLPKSLTNLHASLRAEDAGLAGQRVLAFAGIGRPAKFFATLAESGAIVAGQRSFADHHRFRLAELQMLARQADRLGARLVTTPKDAVRLPPDWRGKVTIAGVELVWVDEAGFERLLSEFV